MLKTTAEATFVDKTDMIELFGYEWELNSQYDLSNLDEAKRVQVRDGEHYAPKENVQQFAAQMAQSAFPPIIVTKDDWIVDGNTRVGAYKELRQKIAPAIIISVERSKLTEAKYDNLLVLAASLNQTGGARLTPKEVRLRVATCLKLGFNPEKIGQWLGAKASVVSQVKREMAAKDKLAKVGLTTKGLDGAALRALGADAVANLNDQPFRELVGLALDAGLTSKEIREGATNVRAAGSDDKALEKIATLRSEMSNRIREKQQTGNARPAASRQLRQHLGFVLKYERCPADIVEQSTGPEVGELHLQTIDRAIAVLTEVRRLQSERTA